MVSSQRLSSWLLPLACLFSVALSASFQGSPLIDRAASPCTTALASPTPSGYVCGVQGTLEHPTIIATTTSASQVACRNTCLNDSTCSSFSYGPGKTCMTYSAKINMSGFKRSQSGKSFWNQHCYTTTCNCPQDQTQCSRTCVDTLSNNNMCGSCTNVCTNNTMCIGGVCACYHGPLGTNFNCGTCGTQCPPDQNCSGGTCVCDPNQTTCSQNCGPAQCTATYDGLYLICGVIGAYLDCLLPDGNFEAVGGRGADAFSLTRGQWHDGNGNYLYMTDGIEGGTVTLDSPSTATGSTLQCTIPYFFSGGDITCYNVLGQALAWYYTTTDTYLHLGLVVPPEGTAIEIFDH